MTDGIGAVLSQHTYTYNTQDLRASEIFDGSAIPPAPVVPDADTTYTVNTVNQLLSTAAPDRTFVYDNDGNLTKGYTKDGIRFTAAYDAENRMTSVTFTPSGGATVKQTFKYNGQHRMTVFSRYKNTTLAETIRVVSDGLLAIQDRNASNAVVREYTWGLNLGGGIEGLLNLKTAGQNYSYLYDGKGNVEAVLNASQQVVAAYRYDPFGVLLAKTGAFEQPFGFSTKRTDPRTGLVFFEYRPYDPPSGRWLTRDPLGEAGGLNLYAFVGNNPVNWVDPWGLTENEWTFGEIREWAIISLRDFTAPAGLADAKASIGACCGRGRPCHAVNGANATEPGDQAAWENIVNATGGVDQTNGAEYMCVGNPQACWYVHSCYACNGNERGLTPRDEDIQPLGTVTVGNHGTLYFYDVPLQGWCNQEDYASACQE